MRRELEFDWMNSDGREWGRDLIRLDGKSIAHDFTTAANSNAWYFQGNVWQWGEGTRTRTLTFS